MWETDRVVPRTPRIVGRIAAVLAALLALALVALVVTGAVLEPRTRRGVVDRVAEALQADATIERGDLALVRGDLALESLAVHREDAVGHLAIQVAALHCALPPLGLALVDRDCRSLELTGARLEVSSPALFKLKHPKRPPLHARAVVIDDARLAFAPSAFAAGLGPIAIDVAHAEAGETRFKTPLSWLFALRSLRATLELPAGIAVELRYDAGQLRASGRLLGAAPIAIPVVLPVADPTDDARAEVARLAAFGKDIAARLVFQRAQIWLDQALSR